MLGVCLDVLWSGKEAQLFQALTTTISTRVP